MNVGVTEQCWGESSPLTLISLYKLLGLLDSCEALTTEALKKNLHHCSYLSAETLSRQANG